MPYKNSEKRKEKSRDAARCRRGKESEVFNELASCVPLEASLISQLDKASVMRLGISSLKIGQILQHHNWSGDETKGRDNGLADQLFAKALDGFVFILSSEGDIVYINDAVVKYLGIQQIELMGQSIFDFCDPRDEDEIREAVSMRPHGGSKMQHTDPEERVFFIRLKCTLTSKGRNVNLKSASYKVIKCTGRMVIPSDVHLPGSFPYLLTIGEPIPHPANIEVPMDTNTFLTKHEMDMKFTYCDERVKELLNYDAEDLMGRSLFDYHHAVDSDIVERAYKDLQSKGQTMTGCYRFLAHGGGWAWVVTQATVISNNRNQKAQWVVCVHYVISEVEKKELVLSEVQTRQPEVDHLMTPSTESIFTSLKMPSTHKDINKDMFFSRSMRKELKIVEDRKPEDLLYLAPTAGDEDMPLDIPLTWEEMQRMQNEGEDMISGPAGLLDSLKQEPGLSPVCHTHDMQPMTNLSPASTVSTHSSRMNSPHEYMNTTSPQNAHSMDQFFHNMNIKCGTTTCEDIGLQMFDDTERAPFIPMDPADDLCLAPPSCASLLTMQNDIDPALRGKTEYIFRSKTENIFGERPAPPKPSIRDMISGSTATASIEQPPDIMFEQRKRPLDMNSLETGPPERKIRRCMGPELHQLQTVPNMRGQKMLLNLLMTGEERNGYNTVPLPAPSLKETASSLLYMPMECLTQHDCEVNAPAPFNSLLDGEDLLTALEASFPQC